MDTEPKKSKAKFDWLGWFCVAGVLALIALLATPPILRTRSITVLQEAKSNARSFGFALVEFDAEYYSFPNDATAKTIKEFPGTSLNLYGASSNVAFRQLIAAEYTQSEIIFYSKIQGAIKPDGNISPGKALKKGEVGFSYISGLSTKDDPATPLALTPLIPGTTTFDPRPFNGKAIVLHIDNSVTSHTIHKDGHIYDKRIDLLSPKHPIWKGKTPDIRYPE